MHLNIHASEITRLVSLVISEACMKWWVSNLLSNSIHNMLWYWSMYCLILCFIIFQNNLILISFILIFRTSMPSWAFFNNMMQHRIKQYVDQYHDMLCIELDSESETHLFRHASEITRETKGGYLKGKIIVPKSPKPFYLRLSLVPAEPDLQSNAFHLHPNLLHINLRQNKKNRNLEVSIS